MLVRSLKLKVNKSQEKYLNRYLFHLEGVYNWAIRQIKFNSANGIYLSHYDLQNATSNHAKKIEIHSQVFQATLKQAWSAWDRCFKKLGGQPRLKSRYRRLESFLFPQILERNHPIGNQIHLPGGFNFKFFKQDIPEGKIKTARIQKKSSGWYLNLTIDTNHKITNLKDTEEAVGVDTGFHHLAILSNGIKYENPRELKIGAKCLAQAQRGHDKKLVARLHEKQSNKRKDRNHKDSTEIIRNYKTIYITNDNLVGQAKKFGKSVTEAGIAQLRNFLLYKGLNSGRVVGLVESHYTTMTCSCCGSLTGPTGLKGLAVRDWVCCVCGTHHDRDVNSGQVVLKIGVGTALALTIGVQPSVVDLKQKSFGRRKKSMSGVGGSTANLNSPVCLGIPERCEE